MLSIDRHRGTFLGLDIGAVIAFESPGDFPDVTG
jgi:hypothetical protein